MAQLKIWNGRGDYAELDGHLFVCATSRKHAVELINKAGYSAGRMNLHELDVYYSKDCWGRDMNGIKMEPGVWFQPKDADLCICNIGLMEFDKPHKKECPKRPRRLV
jgi:hypothetical protein